MTKLNPFQRQTLIIAIVLIICLFAVKWMVEHTHVKTFPDALLIPTVSQVQASSTFVLSEKQELKLLLLENADSYKEFKKLEKLIACESSWRPYVRGKSGEYGLFQILPTKERDRQAKELGYDYKNNPKHNILFGLHIWKTEGARAWACSRKLV